MAKAKGFRSKPLSADLSGKRKPEPLRKRDELIEQRRRAYAIYAEQTQLRQRAESAKGAAASRLHRVEDAYTKGSGPENAVNEAEDELQKATEIHDRVLGKANRALDATKRIDYELEQLYGTHFGEFAAEAAGVSKQADAAIDEMLAAYRRAQVAWANAQAAWTPVCHAVRIANMLPFPLTDQLMAPLIQGWEAKPAQIDVMDDDLNEDIEEMALLEGTDVAG